MTCLDWCQKLNSLLFYAELSKSTVGPDIKPEINNSLLGNQKFEPYFADCGTVDVC